MQTELVIAPADAGQSPVPRQFAVGKGFGLEHAILEGGQGFEYALCSASHYLAFHDIVLDDGEIAIVGREVDLLGSVAKIQSGSDLQRLI